MESPHGQDTTQVLSTQAENTEKREKRRKKKGRSMTSPERREEADYSKAGSAIEDTKKKRTKLRSGKPSPAGREEAQETPMTTQQKSGQPTLDKPESRLPESVQKQEKSSRPQVDQQRQEDEQQGQEPKQEQQKKQRIQDEAQKKEVEQPSTSQHREARRGAASRCAVRLLVLLLCTLFVGCFAVLLWGYMMIRLVPSCLHPACRDVLDYMDAIVDKRVHPCHDFYRHVCGHWLPSEPPSPASPPPSSFMADVLRNYTARRHREMIARSAWAEPADAVSRYYTYCVTDLSAPKTLQDIVNKLFEVSNTDRETWLGMTSDQIFFKLLRLCFLYRIHALFKITVSKKEDKVYFEIDRRTSFKNRLPKIDREAEASKYLETVVKAIGSDDVNEAAISSCLALDDGFGFNETLQGSLRPPPQPIADSSCIAFPPEKWLKGLSSQDEVKIPDGASANARDFDGTCSDLTSVLLHEVPRVKTLYTLALLAVNFLKLDFMTNSGSNPEPDLVQRICHDDTVATFKHLWLPALTRVLSISPTTGRIVEDYFSALRAIMQHGSAKQPKWLSDEDRSSMMLKVREIHVTSFNNGTLSKEEIDNSRFNPSYGMRKNDWIYNKVNVMRRTEIVDDVDEEKETPGGGEYWDTLEAQLRTDSETNTIVVPHMFGVPPVFFDDISAASYANLAMLGYQMAWKMMTLLGMGQKAEWWSNDTATNYKAIQRCYADSSGAFHKPLDDEQFDEAVQAALGINFAFRAKSLIEDTGPVTEPQFSSLPLFFRRVCLALCAGGTERVDVNSLSRDTAAAACTLGVSAMEEFHEIFNCNNEHQMAAPRKCGF